MTPNGFGATRLWLSVHVLQEPFIQACVTFLKRRCPTIMGGLAPEKDQPKSAQLPPETLATMLACLQSCAGWELWRLGHYFMSRADCTEPWLWRMKEKKTWFLVTHSTKMFNHTKLPLLFAANQTKSGWSLLRGVAWCIVKIVLGVLGILFDLCHLCFVINASGVSRKSCLRQSWPWWPTVATWWTRLASLHQESCRRAVQPAPAVWTPFPR